MRLYEYEAKAIFKKFGIPIPQGKLASNAVEAQEVARDLNKPVVLKAQVLVGGRGKAGGVKIANNPEESRVEASQLIGKEIKGSRINKLLVEEKLNITKEFYMGITVDRVRGTPVLMASSEGGVNIEDLAAKTPEKITMLHPDILKGVREYETRRMLKQIGIKGSALPKISSILMSLYSVFRGCDAEIAEINPLVLTSDGNIVAADAKLNIDDHSLFRHPEIEAPGAERFESPLEWEAYKRGVNFVDLDGTVAVMGNGAGLVMALLDAIKNVGGQPACFLDTGGGLSSERAENALDLLLMKADSDPKVKSIFFTFWFMISPAEEATQGFLNVIAKKKPKIPIIGVIQGIAANKAAEILQGAGIKCYPTVQEGVKAAVAVR